MAADVAFRPDSEDGQSIVEFVLLLPLLVGLSVLLIRINTAIQISIVNQKYARMYAHWATFNSPYYPQRDQRSEGSSRFTVGVAAQSIAGRQKPRAMETFVGRLRTIASEENNSPQVEPAKRANVRIRSTATLCSYSHTIGKSGKPNDSETLRGFEGDRSAGGNIFQYCGGPQDHE